MATKALKTFRLKMANPMNWRKANRVFAQYTQSEISTVPGARRLVIQLAKELNVELPDADALQAAQWLSQQGIDPTNKKQRLMLWKKVKQ